MESYATFEQVSDGARKIFDEMDYSQIEKDAFNCCSVMPIINIPASVTTIEAGAFPNCTSLTNISVDSQNPSYSSQDGVLFNKDKTTLLYYPEDKTDASYAVPDTVTTIANYAFNGNKNLETVNISDGTSVIYARLKN